MAGVWAHHGSAADHHRNGLFALALAITETGLHQRRDRESARIPGDPMSSNALTELSKIEASLWAAADPLRANSKLTSSEYCMPVLHRLPDGRPAAVGGVATS